MSLFCLPYCPAVHNRLPVDYRSSTAGNIYRMFSIYRSFPALGNLFPIVYFADTQKLKAQAKRHGVAMLFLFVYIRCRQSVCRSLRISRGMRQRSLGVGVRLRFFITQNFQRCFYVYQKTTRRTIPYPATQAKCFLFFIVPFTSFQSTLHFFPCSATHISSTYNQPKVLFPTELQRRCVMKGFPVADKVECELSIFHTVIRGVQYELQESEGSDILSDGVYLAFVRLEEVTRLLIAEYTDLKR